MLWAQTGITSKVVLMRNGTYHLLTHHGTAVFYDVAERRICHADSAGAPKNLALEVCKGRCRLLLCLAGSSQLIIADSEGFCNLKDTASDEFPFSVRPSIPK
jgi:hypothetical protein